METMPVPHLARPGISNMSTTCLSCNAVPNVLLSLLFLGITGGVVVAEDVRSPAAARAQPMTEAAAVSRRVSPGHARMLDQLSWIAERTPVENPYLGDRRLRELRKRVARLRGGSGGEAHARLYRALGAAELRVGNTKAAIDHFTSAYQIVPGLAARAQSRVGSEVELAYDLAVAHLHWDLRRNCVDRQTSESCNFPIAHDDGRTRQEASRKAIDYLNQVLNSAPPDTSMHGAAKWLLNIAYMSVGEYPDGVPTDRRIPPAMFDSDEEFPRFRNIAPSLGLNTMSLCGGAIAEDFNGDGILDLVTSTWDSTGQMRYFRNNGDGTFSDRTKEAGLAGMFGGLNMIHADYDNDGDSDIFVLRGAWLGANASHPNSLLRNNGDESFTDVTFDVGLGDVHYPTQTAAWADYDNDGDLDLYIGNEGTPQNGVPCQLFENNGDGTFTDVARRAHVRNFRFAKAVVWGDYNGDRFPDIYVSNLRQRNRLYLNRGDGTFTDVAPALGVTGPMDSFPVWFWDFDNDGVLDLFVSSFYQAKVPNRLYAVAASYVGMPRVAEHPCLYRGDGQGGFSNVTVEQNLARVTLPMGSNFGDLDNDGFPDFYLGTGYPFLDALMPNVMYHNLRGKGFADITTAGGFGHLHKGHAVVFADLDNDGDQDIFQQMGGAYPSDAFGDVLYENPGFGNHWIKIKLVGVRSNRSAIGARIRAEVLEKSKRRSIYKYVNTGGSFGANSLMQHIGLGLADKIEVLEVFWPTTGSTQTFKDVPVDQKITIVEGSDRYQVVLEKEFEFRR